MKMIVTLIDHVCDKHRVIDWPADWPVPQIGSKVYATIADGEEDAYFVVVRVNYDPEHEDGPRVLVYAHNYREDQVSPV